MVLATAACGSAGGTIDEEITTSDNAPIVDWDTFRASAQWVPKHGFVVDGDLFFGTEGELYDYWQQELASGQEQSLTLSGTPGARWSPQQAMSLTYCVGSGFTTAQLNQLLPALDAAGKVWSEIAAVRYSRKTVSGTCDANNTSVVFDVRPDELGTTIHAQAFYPYDTRDKRTLWVDDSAYTYTENGYNLTRIIAHEFGHTLGFRHEHIWRPSGDSCLDSIGNAIPITPYDAFSIMHYAVCRSPPSAAPTLLSESDRYGVALLYGLAPALNSTVTTALLDL